MNEEQPLKELKTSKIQAAMHHDIIDIWKRNDCGVADVLVSITGLLNGLVVAGALSKDDFDNYLVYLKGNIVIKQDCKQ